VGADGTVRLAPVTTRGVTAERVVVDSGLAAGDLVVVAGAQLLRPGQRVRPMTNGQ
jgi:multidrug efflux pump subunit AcrA (membrane-fusion protein)